MLQEFFIVIIVKSLFAMHDMKNLKILDNCLILFNAGMHDLNSLFIHTEHGQKIKKLNTFFMIVCV